jgi:hypothetical protein
VERLTTTSVSYSLLADDPDMSIMTSLIAGQVSRDVLAASGPTDLFIHLLACTQIVFTIMDKAEFHNDMMEKVGLAQERVNALSREESCALRACFSEKNSCYPIDNWRVDH